jgi:hypothetical protein
VSARPDPRCEALKAGAGSKDYELSTLSSSISRRLLQLRLAADLYRGSDNETMLKSLNQRLAELIHQDKQDFANNPIPKPAQE